jgi:uncharacterized protein (DUF2267 family)
MDEAEVRKIVQEEVGKVSSQIAEQIQSVLEKSLTQFNGRFESIYREQNNAAVAINAVVGILLDKNTITKDEMSRKMDEVLKRVREKARTEAPKTE